MSNHKNLIWYNKEGDYLNFRYSDTTERFEGNILFHENSTDTFKTYGLYMFERVLAFEYEVPDVLTLAKFQLFNEYSIDIHGAKYATQSVTLIEPVNNDPDFSSKWIYGINFESKFPIGTHIIFDTPFLEFTNSQQTYIVVGSKKGAIMVISLMDNQTFESTFYAIYSDPTQYGNIYISGLNLIGVYNYIDAFYNNNLSNWSEPNFYDKYTKGRRLNIVNSDKNKNADNRFTQKVVTVVDDNLTDTVFFEYDLPNVSLPSNTDLIIELISKTDLPLVYDGPLSISSNSISFGVNTVPIILKPGIIFKINGSVNTSFYTVDSIVNFTSINQPIYYATQSLVTYNNRIYECIQAYEQYTTSPDSPEFFTSKVGLSTGYLVDPENTIYWKLSTKIPVAETLTPESLLASQVYLSSNKLYFVQPFTQSQSITLASAVEKYAEQFSIFNVDLYYSVNKLKSDLMYPTRYVDVNYYHTKVGSTYSIGSGYIKNYERVVRVEQELVTELNYNISENFEYNIVFTDLDEFGLIIKINKMVYQEEISWVYSGISPDMPRTIDRTLRNWLTKNHPRLVVLGIFATLQYIGSGYSIFFNSVKLTTEYPNVPMDFEVQVGTTADFHIEHSRVLFNELGSYLSVKINNRDYSIDVVYLTYPTTVDIPGTLQLWSDEYSDILQDFGIYTTIINNMIKFDVKEQDQRLEYEFSIGKSTLPGIPGYSIIRKIKGNEGLIITSNQIQLPGSTYSLEQAGFATGMVVAINNTIHPYNNQEYIVLGLDPDRIDLSYEGPFWGLTDDICSISPFVNIAYNLGFGATGCAPIVGPTAGTGGPFNQYQFSNLMFSISYNPNAYVVNTYNLSSYQGSSNMVDITYVQLSNSIYALGDDITVMDSYFADYLTTISLPGNTQSLHLRFNSINNYLYSLSKNILYVIDPLLNSIISTITLVNDAFDIEINTYNGDIYISYQNTNRIDIYNYLNALVTTLTSGLSWVSGKTYNMTFNEYEKDMYVITDDSSNIVLRIDGTTRTLQSVYGIPGLSSMSSSAYNIYYEPVNEAVYVWGSASLYKIDNGLSPISIPNVPTQGFNEILFSNLTGQMYISDSSTSFQSLDLNTNANLFNTDPTTYGYLALNQYDGDIYLSSLTTNTIKVMSPINGSVINGTIVLTDQTTKIIYDPDRKSVWAIQPNTNSIIEIVVDLTSFVSTYVIPTSNIDENQYGTLDPNYVHKDNLWLKTREYIRAPRENFLGEPRVTYYYRWMTDNVPEMFLYDFSGDQLPITGSYAYTGAKPLTEVMLNKVPNKNLNNVSLPQAQQTIFDRVYYSLDHIDEETTNIYLDPSPVETFIGFNSPQEGSMRSILQLFKRENVTFEINTTSTNNNIITFKTFVDIDGVSRGEIKLNIASTEYFVYDNNGNKRGLKVGQLLRIDIKDKTNTKKQYISGNSGRIFKVKNVYNRTIVVDFIRVSDSMLFENTIVSNYPTTGKTTYLGITFTALDREIGRFNVLGQTEDEDVRFKVELSNVGKNIGSDEIFIFKEYDIYEGGIDWTYLNKKRKEMLMQKHLIYPYIGSYKSIINAINFFGYNDLELNEYYRNINELSEIFGRLFKVEIPDIFDNTVEGWTENDFIKHTFPNPNYESTNLFNLTFKITDKEGNNILLYSLEEVQIKLQGLKYWLQKNIIPLTHKILDITGRADFVGVNTIEHRSFDIHQFNIKQNMSPVTFKLNEAYLMPINNGSTQYTCVLDFNLLSSSLYSSNVSTYPSASTASIPDFYNISIRTYKTYPEWNPFTTYQIGDNIIYYNKLYQSVINNNRVKNPRKYDASTEWSYPSGTYSFSVGQVYKYDRDYYVYSGIGVSSATSSTYSTITPNKDTSNWLNVTEWREMDFMPVQHFSEFRGIENLYPYNFTIDSNIDPFLVIEITSDNGYGQTYRDRKNYEIRGLLDIRNGVVTYDPIGPFIPISPITTLP